MRHLDHHRKFLQRQLDERIGFRSCWKEQRLPTNPTKTKKPNYQEREIRGWATVHPGDRKRCLVWSWRHQKLNMNGETCGCTVIQPELCASVCWTCRWRQRRSRRRRRRSNKNEETCEWTTNRFVHTVRGNRHWLQSVWIATCSCETSRELPRPRAREEHRESSSSRSTSSRFETKQRLQPI